MEKKKEIPEVQSYSEQLETRLNAGLVLNQLVEAFDDFFARRKISKLDELTTLRLIKVFLHEEKGAIKDICAGSILSHRDCLTLSVMTCLLAGRRGFQVKIGRPEKISRYFHSLITRKNGEIFKVSGSDRNHKAKEMNVDEVLDRFKYIHPIIKTADLIKSKC